MQLADPIVYQKLLEMKVFDNEAKLTMFLHEQGYTFFNIPQLTLHEIMLLCHGSKLQQQEMKKQSRRK